MIIQIAGTSGSGKSHLMRSFMSYLAKEGFEPEEQFIEDRKAPIGYLYNTKKEFGHNCFIPGAYETPTGGCDTINNVAHVFKLVEANHLQNRNVLFEGLFCMNQTRGPELASRLGKHFAVLQLSTPLGACLASINARRAERGEGELANKKNTTDNYKRAENYSYRMRDAGARVYRVSRDEGLDKILELLHD